MKRTDIICIIDKSGSMHNLTEDTIGGFNRFLAEQQAMPGEASLSVILFDTNVYTLYDRVPIKEAAPLTQETYKPGGSTALLDAVGSALAAAEPRFLPPVEFAAVLIITDGEENASKEHTKGSVKETVERLTKTGKWDFSFLGANVDAFAEAGAIGIGPGQTANYSATGVGTMSAYDALSGKTRSIRTTGMSDPNWKAEVK